MYSVSAAFMTALHAPARFEKLRGTIGSVSFTDSNIISLSYSNRCSDTSDVTFGSAYIGQIDVTFVNVNIARGAWRNKVINLEWGLVLADDSVEYIPIGKFYVTSAEHSAAGVSVKASDVLSKLDKDCIVSNTNGELYDMLSLAATSCGISLGVTKAQVRAMPNGTEYLGVYAESDIKTWRDFVSWIAQTAGGFAYATRDGKLAIKSFSGLSSVDTLTQYHRDYGSVFSDYTTQYEGISVVNIEDNTTTYYQAGLSGAVINLGSNPLLQYGTAQEVATRRNAIAQVAASIQYVPFTSSILSCGVYDLGDVITCSGGWAGSSSISCCIMGIDWNTKQQTTLSGYGADPSLTSGKSKTDKVINGILNKEGNVNKVAVVTFVNAEAHTIGSTWRQIAELHVGVLEDQIVQLHGVIKLNLTEAGIVKVRYKLNDDYLPFIHICQFPIGTDTITLYIPISITNEEVNEIKLEIQSDDGIGTISVGDEYIGIQGTNITTLGWDGYINAADTYAFPFQTGIGFTYTGENVSVDKDVPYVTHSLSDTTAFPFQSGIGFTYAETQNTDVRFLDPYYYLQTEDEVDTIVTEDGSDAIITEY